jgi:hypothetical protein
VTAGLFGCRCRWPAASISICSRRQILATMKQAAKPTTTPRRGRRRCRCGRSCTAAAWGRETPKSVAEWKQLMREGPPKDKTLAELCRDHTFDPKFMTMNEVEAGDNHTSSI